MPENDSHYIAEWAAGKNVGQADIARTLGADIATVSLWFKGLVPPHYYLTPLARYLDAPSVASLFVHPEEYRILQMFRDQPVADRKRMIRVLEAASRKGSDRTHDEAVTTRIAFVGNSHLAAIKLGWRAARHDGFKAIFFGAPQPRMRHLQFRDGMFWSDDERLTKMLRRLCGITTLRPADFDVVVLVGMRFGLTMMLQIMQEGPDSHSSKLYRRLKNSLSVRAARFVKETGVPCLLIPDPIPSVTLAATSPWNERGDEFDTMISDAIATCDAVIARIAEEEGLSIIHQPKMTRAANGLTKESYSRESPRMEGQRPFHDADFGHLNSDYGRLVVEAVLSAAARNPEVRHKRQVSGWLSGLARGIPHVLSRMTSEKHAQSV